jgi:hypothetical protein
LSGEIRYQLDLLGSERAHCMAVNSDDADDLILLEHWNGNIRARAA